MNNKNPNNYKIIGWTIGYECNFRCPYCFVWRDASNKDLKLSVNEWIKIWDRINSKYGKCVISLSGGEPSLYPGFFDIVKYLSKNNICVICTNFSWDPHKLIPETSETNLKIFATFHPSFMDFGVFYEKVKFARKYLDNDAIAYVAYKKQMEKIPYYKKELEKIGVKLMIHPLRDEGFDIENGEIKNTDNSKGQKIINDNEEKKIILDNTIIKDDYRFGLKSPKGKLCRSGKDAVCIWPDGTINRCTRYREEIMGNITDKDFKFFDKPMLCNKELCNIEYEYGMIVE